MASWRVIVAQYASAIQLWRCAANYAEWIRGRLVEEFFTRMLSSSRYLSHIRSALRLLEAPVGVLAETTEIICGAMKLSASGVRFMPRAEAEQTKALVNYAREREKRKKKERFRSF